MKANEAKLIKVIEGTNQYLVPHFQRPYTWQRPNWETLWSDIDFLRQNVGSTDREHFMGAIVTAPAHSVPEGVAKYLLIDGQQRLTTLFLLLAAIRDRAKVVGDNTLDAKINDLYLTNRYQDGFDRFKLLPTQGDEPKHNDRAAFEAIIDRRSRTEISGALTGAYEHFSRLLKSYSNDDLTALANCIVGRVSLVSIVLERDDNPYAIFESLNAKGQPLTQADLVRNYFFMSINPNRHDEIFSKRWSPMERLVGRENMESYLRHYLIRSRGALVKESDVYFTLKRQVDDAGYSSAESQLEELERLSRLYVRLIDPSKEPSRSVRDRLVRLERLRATVCYPFLLHVFEDQSRDRLSEQEVLEIIGYIENFIVRRYVCGTMRAELNELFAALYRYVANYSSLKDGVREILASRTYPSDEEFTQELQSRRLYRAGEARDRTKFILEQLENITTPKEQAAYKDMSIEHVMPQSLTVWWRRHLGEDAEEIHELLLHTIGNLTLTGYNAELSNASFDEKRHQFKQSNVALNREIACCEKWMRSEIEARGARLANRALDVWPSFAPREAIQGRGSVTGKTPETLRILDRTYDVQTWQDVWRITLEVVCELGEDVVEQVIADIPRYVNRSPARMKTPRRMDSGVYYESHLNAQIVHRLCSQIAQIAGLSSREWNVRAN